MRVFDENVIGNKCMVRPQVRFLGHYNQYFWPQTFFVSVDL